MRDLLFDLMSCEMSVMADYGDDEIALKHDIDAMSDEEVVEQLKIFEDETSEEEL